MINVLTYAYGTTYTQHKHYIYNYTDVFCCIHYAKPSLCTTVFNYILYIYIYIYICICNDILTHMPIFLRANMYIHMYIYIYIYYIYIYIYIYIYMIWYCACHMLFCVSYCFINWIVYNLVSGIPMTGTFSFQAIAVAPRGKRAMELLNITVGALAQLIRAARDP